MWLLLRLAEAALLPCFRSGDTAVTQAIRDLEGRHSAVMLAKHGPVVVGRGLEESIFTIEELEETSKLAFMLRGMPTLGLDEAQVQDIVTHFDVD